MIRAALLVLALCASAVFGPGVAQAQTGPTTAYSGLAAINKIILNTPGVTAVATGGSATVSATAAETVGLASSGLRVPVMVTAAAGISAARLAGLAATAMKMGTFIGAATIILPMISNATGIVVCPPPQFFCKPDPKGPAPSDTLGHWTQSNGTGGGACRSASENCSMQAAANAYCQAVYPTTWKGATYPYDPGQPSYSTSAHQWTYYNFCNSSNGMNEALHMVSENDVSTCPDGYYLSKGMCVSIGAQIPLVDAPASDISNALPTPLATQANMQNAIDSARLSNVALLDSTSPVTVTAPSVTTQPQTKTETITNADGTTSTKVTTTTSVINPTITGTTVGNTQISYPTTTTQTTQITNNSTGAVTTTTITINEYGTPQTPDKLDLPTDYNREATQRRIEADLNTDGAPTLPDQKAVVTAAQADSDSKMAQMRNDAQNGMPADENKFWNFLFTPPSGTCSPFTVTVHGNSGQVDLCDWVGRLRDLLGWLMALGTAYGVWRNMMGGTDG